jgi:hypothetical protein
LGQELGATINAQTMKMKMPDKRVQAPMPVRYNSVRAGPHRPFCGGEGTDQSIIHAVYNAPQMYPTYIVELELQMEASVQACLSAEVEQAGAPAAKRQRTAGGANVGGAGASVVGSSAAGSAARVPATPRLMQLVEQLRSGAAATKADAALKLGRISERSETERSGIVAANAIGPLVALLQHGDADGKRFARLALDRLNALPPT